MSALRTSDLPSRPHKTHNLLRSSELNQAASSMSDPKPIRKQHSHEVSSPSTFSETGERHSFGVTSPEYAAPSGFLNLVTLSSARPRSALFHAESVHGVVAPRGFLSFSSRHDFRRALPLQLESAIAKTTFRPRQPMTTEAIIECQKQLPPISVASRIDPQTEPSLRDSCTWKIRSQ